MKFASDNSGPVPQQVLDALAKANTDYVLGYGDDDLTLRVTDQIRTLFEAPEASVFLVATGTAANALALSTLCQPFETVFCTPMAHINVDECNAPEFYTGGAKLTLVPGTDKMAPAALRGAILGEENRGVHGAKRGPVSITNVTEMGNVYSLPEMKELCALAHEFGLPVQLDGARFSNACAALGCTPADMSWRLGVDVAVFGGTKNGLMGVEAVILFDPSKANEFALRRKRAGHLFSKHRYLAAQMSAYLQDDLWLDLARKANANCARLAAGLRRHGLRLINDPVANMIFFEAPRALHQALRADGAVYHVSGPETGAAEDMLTGRLVCDWSMTDLHIDSFVRSLGAHIG